MIGAQVGDTGAKLKPPTTVKAEVFEDDAVKITWKDACSGEAGFRVDRKIDDGPWTPIAYRPPQIDGHPENPPAWIDFLAPTEKPLVYRVVALDAQDNDTGASQPTATIRLKRP
jgi:hypothetical protein